MKCDRQFDIFLHGQSGQQRATLEQHAPLFVWAGFVIADFLAQHFDRSFVRPVQAENASKQNRFAGAGATDDAQDLIPPDVQFQLVMHGLFAKPVDQPVL